MLTWVQDGCRSLSTFVSDIATAGKEIESSSSCKSGSVDDVGAIRRILDRFGGPHPRSLAGIVATHSLSMLRFLCLRSFRAA